MTTPFNLAKLNLHVTMMKSILVTFLKGSVGGFSDYLLKFYKNIFSPFQIPESTSDT